jgi:ribosomal protein L39E
MKKYGIAKRGFGKALRQNFGVGGMVVKKSTRKIRCERKRTFYF